MKTVKHEIKLERSVKIILAVFAVGVLLHAFTIVDLILFGIIFFLPSIWYHFLLFFFV